MNQTATSPCRRQASGNLFILSAPSGAGKTTLCRALRLHFPDILYSISYTTRPPRAGERDGIDYFFIDVEDFQKRRAAGQWAEWARVHDHYYGTSIAFIRDGLAAGKDILLDIDVQGTFQILGRFPDSVTIFIMPPDIETLQMRLEARGEDRPEVISKRIKNAGAEMEKKSSYRHVIINDRLEKSTAELISLVGRYRQEKAHPPAGRPHPDGGGHV